MPRQRCCNGSRRPFVGRNAVISSERRFAPGRTQRRSSANEAGRTPRSRRTTRRRGRVEESRRTRPTSPATACLRRPRLRADLVLVGYGHDRQEDRRAVVDPHRGQSPSGARRTSSARRRTAAKSTPATARTTRCGSSDIVQIVVPGSTVSPATRTRAIASTSSPALSPSWSSSDRARRRRVARMLYHDAGPTLEEFEERLLHTFEVPAPLLDRATSTRRRARSSGDPRRLEGKDQLPEVARDERGFFVFARRARAEHGSSRRTCLGRGRDASRDAPARAERRRQGRVGPRGAIYDV